MKLDDLGWGVFRLGIAIGGSFILVGLFAREKATPLFIGIIVLVFFYIVARIDTAMR